jgi:hypothetical protein
MRVTSNGTVLNATASARGSNCPIATSMNLL